MTIKRKKPLHHLYYHLVEIPAKNNEFNESIKTNKKFIYE